MVRVSKGGWNNATIKIRGTWNSRTPPTHTEEYWFSISVHCRPHAATNTTHTRKHFYFMVDDVFKNSILQTRRLCFFCTAKLASGREFFAPVPMGTINHATLFLWHSPICASLKWITAYNVNFVTRFSAHHAIYILSNIFNLQS